MNNKKGVFLIGSPRKNKSSSFVLGNVIVEKLRQNGYVFSICYSHSLINEDITEFLHEINNCNILIISSPLYVDSLPSPLIQVLEKVYDSRKELVDNLEPNIIGMINSGFPEKIQSEMALKILKQFSLKSKFNWLGGLAMGPGPMLVSSNGISKFAKAKVKGLNRIAIDILNDKPISNNTQRLIEKKLIPHWIYRFVLNRNFKSYSKACGTYKNIKDRPFTKN